MHKSDKQPGAASPWDIAVACVLLTRLPMPPLAGAVFDRQARAAWAYPLAGLAVAALATAVGALALAIGLGAGVAAGLVLLTQIALTGAMHEDGLADTADGLWGGFDSTRRLEIMKDSAIGTYGVLALALSLGLRWVALAALIPAGFGPVLAAAVLSRALLPALMTALPAARRGGLSQSVGVPGWDTSGVAIVIALGLALVSVGIPALGALLAAVIGCAGLAALARARIGGQTGDILGAAQQVGEILVLLVLLSAL